MTFWLLTTPRDLEKIVEENFIMDREIWKAIKIIAFDNPCFLRARSVSANIVRSLRIVERTRNWKVLTRRRCDQRKQRFESDRQLSNDSDLTGQFKAISGVSNDFVSEQISFPAVSSRWNFAGDPRRKRMVDHPPRMPREITDFLRYDIPRLIQWLICNGLHFVTFVVFTNFLNGS